MTLQSDLKQRIESLANDFADAVVEAALELIAGHLRGAPSRPAVAVAPAATRPAPAPAPRPVARRVSAARLLRVLKAHPEGMSADALRTHLHLGAAPLPRALKVLVASGRVKELGEGERTRYAVPLAAAARPANGTNGASHAVKRGAEILLG
jgi:hypothetical protein